MLNQCEQAKIRLNSERSILTSQYLGGLITAKEYWHKICHVEYQFVLLTATKEELVDLGQV